MNPTAHCNTCGAPLPEGTNEQCPRCLLGLGLAAGEEPGLDRFTGVLPVQRSFGDYELLEEIARGGMGVVYRARQISLNRLVAVKMILAGHFAGPDSVKRFRAEAEAAAGLRHPHIVAIHEIGEREGQHFFSMDYLEGRNLAEAARDSPMPVRRAAACVRTMAGAIQFAHERGVLHRDLKPSNVLLDADGEPHITDFGLAKRYGVPPSVGQPSIRPHTTDPDRVSPSSAPDPGDLTTTGQVLGSPNYMPPEQASGKRGVVSPASDVYGLGAILYHLLTGRGPFVSDAVTETLHHVLHEDPVAPRLLNPALPRDLETICLKCLEKEQARRYSSAQELADELERFLRDEPIHARPAGRWEKAWRWCRRKPVIASLAAGIIALLLTVAIGSPVALYHITEERRRAERNAANESLEHQRADQELWRSYLAQAQARRWSGRAGRRFESLEALRKAAELRPGFNTLELRNEAIACLALVDLRVAKQWPAVSEPGTRMVFDLECRRYARRNQQGAISVCRAEDDHELLLVPAGEAPYREFNFTPDGRYLIAVFDRTGRFDVWDLSRNQIVLAPTNHSLRTWNYHPSRRRLVVAYHYGEYPIVTYDLASGQKLRSFDYGRLPWSVQSDPTGEMLAVSSDQSTKVDLLEAQTARMLQSFSHPAPVMGIFWHPDGKLLATACVDKRAYVWDIVTGKLRTVLSGHQGAVTWVRFTRAGDLLGSDSWDGTFRLWEPFEGRQLLTMPLGGAGYFSPDDRWLPCVLDASTRAVLELAPGRELRWLRSESGIRERPNSCAFSRDGSLLASCHNDGVRLHTLTDGRQVALFGEESTHEVLFHSDGRSLVTSGTSGLRQWPVEFHDDGRTNHLHIGPSVKFGPAGKMECLTLTPDGRTLACLRASDVSIHVLDWETRQTTRRFRGPERAWTIALSPDGRWLASSSFVDVLTRVWDLSTEVLVAKLTNTFGAQAAFSPDSRWLATSGNAGQQLWETGSWNLHHALPPSPSIERAVAFAVDGSLVALRGGRGSVRLLDPATAREFATLEPPETINFGSLHFSPDGGYLAVGCPPHHVQLWDLRTIRRQLAAMKLDWALPPLPPPPQEPLPPLAVTVLGLTNGAPSPTKSIIPPRDPGCPSRSIDLTRFYNAALTESWFDQQIVADDLSRLSTGRQVIGGIEYDVRGLIQLAGSHPEMKPGYPRDVYAIPIGLTCRALHFLHATSSSTSSNAPVGEYVVHYVDGQTRKIALIYDRNIRNSWTREEQFPSLDKETSVVWKGANDRSRIKGYDLYLYKFRWENPRPEVAIATLDFRSTLAKAAPFLIALTTE